MISSFGSALETNAPSALDALCSGHEVHVARRESLRIAIEMGAPQATLERLRDARRLNRRDTVVLPRGKFEHCSRGRGWCRQGKGSSAVWADTDNDGYRVGPGLWSVGSTDGFSRKSDVQWDVEHIHVGDQTWTIAR